MSKTNLSISIETTEELIRRYNECVCKTLADPQVLAYILKYTMSEFENSSIDYIIGCIEEIEVRSRNVDSGYSNMGRIVGSQTVDLDPDEGEIRFDIRFILNHVKKRRILINVEAQNSSKKYELKYHIENRIQYYLGRMISAQKNTEFFNDDYDDLRKVVSIWLCMDSGKNDDGITKF